MYVGSINRGMLFHYIVMKFLEDTYLVKTPMENFLSCAFIAVRKHGKDLCCLEKGQCQLTK